MSRQKVVQRKDALTKSAILVLGPPRSGTSAMCHALSILGVDFGDENRFIDPRANPHNPIFFELRTLNELNEEILNYFGASYYTANFLPQHSDFDNHCLSRFEPIIDRFLATEFGNSKIIGLKDPRFCFTLPIWQALLRKAGYSVGYVLANRSLGAVIASNVAVNGKPVEYNFALVVESVLVARYFLRHSLHVEVSYDRLVRNPEKELRPLIKQFGLNEKGLVEACSVISVTSMHFKGNDTLPPSTRDYLLDLEGSIDSSVELEYQRYREVVGAARRFAEHQVRELHDEIVLVTARSGSLQDQLEQARNTIVERDEIAAELRDQIGTLHIQLSEHAEGIATLNQELTRGAAENLHLKSEIDRLLSDVLESDRSMARLRDETTALSRQLVERNSRIVAMETDIRNHEGQAIALRHDIQCMREHLGGLEHDIATLRAELKTARCEISEREQELRQSRGELADRINEIERLRQLLDQSRTTVVERDNLVAELREELIGAHAALGERNERINNLIGEAENRAADLMRLRKQVTDSQEALRGSEAALGLILQSKSWRLTKPLRVGNRVISVLRSEFSAFRTRGSFRDPKIVVLLLWKLFDGSVLRGIRSYLSEVAANKHSCSALPDLAAVDQRYLAYWSQHEPRTSPVEDMRRAIEQQHGCRFSPIEHQSLIEHGLVPWIEISPNRPFKQAFLSPVSYLDSLSIIFFTYCEANRMTVRVTLSTTKDGLNPERPIFSHLITADKIRDGQATDIRLASRIPHADRQIFLIEIASVDAPPSARITVALAQSYYPAIVHQQQSGTEGRVLAIYFNQARDTRTRKHFAFISGCPGDSFRYRCEHHAEALRLGGYSVELFKPHQFPFDELLSNYRIVVAHRVPHTSDFEKFVSVARQKGVAVVYDVDDLIFDPDRVDQIDAVKHMTLRERAEYVDGLRRYQKALDLCDAVTVSTEKLKEEIQRLFRGKYVAIVRNRVSEEMVSLANAALDNNRPEESVVRIAYFSGTKTHQKDFSVCEEALTNLLKHRKNARLLLVGHLDVPAILKKVAGQIETHPFVAWQSLAHLYHTVDINLAPLEYKNDFTEAKSELKWLEAALLGLPTVASDLGAYRSVVKNGIDGFLCASTSEWERVLCLLVDDHQYRHQVGEAARSAVSGFCTTRTTAGLLAQQWASVLSNVPHVREKRKSDIAISFVARAPIPGTGGGYKKIFILANALFEKGYDVRVHVEAIEHLSGLSEQAIKRFCRKHFDTPESVVRVGHHTIEQSDIAIATNWPTAYVVDRLGNTSCKAYFVQDYEPLFYGRAEREYEEAERTYDLPLGIITIGSYLCGLLSKRNRMSYRQIGFAVDEAFHRSGVRRKQLLESGSGYRGQERCTILFFARPQLERRNFPVGVDALARLHRRYPHVNIQLYGMDSPVELSFPYTNLGKLSQDNLADAMAQADIHLSFSMSNISTVIYEAMACGCAAVEAKIPPVQAMVKDGEVCLLAEPTGEKTFRVLEELVTNAELRTRIAKNGLKFAERLTNKTMCDEFEQHIRAMLFLGQESRVSQDQESYDSQEQLVCLR